MDMDKYYPFNAISGDRTHDADDLARILKALISNGVAMVNATDMQVVAAGDFDVTVGTGCCVAEGRLGVNTSEKTFTIAAPYAGADRIDRIVARADYANRKMTLVYVQGVPASSPVAPDLQNNADGFDIPLAQIAVASGAASITQSVITDERTACGLVVPNHLEEWLAQTKALLEEDTAEMLDGLSTWTTAQQSAFEAWFATIQNTLDGDTAGNLLNLINQYRAYASQETLLVTGWTASGDVYTQTLAVSIVPANCVLHASPAEASRAEYLDNDIHVSVASEGSVTFTASGEPGNDLMVNLSVSEVSA